MDPITILQPLLEKVSPDLIPLIPLTAPGIKFAIDIARRSLFPRLQGNIIQTVTFLLALAVVVVEAGIATDIFANGTDVREIGGLVIVAALNSAGATWLDQLLTNTNKRDEAGRPDGSRDDEGD